MIHTFSQNFSPNTVLLFKKGDPKDPKNYRPITCLSVIYKLFTAVINERLYQHCQTHQIFEAEQKGCIRAALGCKEQLTIDSVILKQVQKKQKNLNISYIDYSKAFDSVPHDWLLRVLDIYKVCPRIINTLGHLMRQWRTDLKLPSRHIGTVRIKRGIFQGDSLSPLWFCLAMNPMSTLLNHTTAGYKIDQGNGKRLNHLLYMDDLKLYGETPSKLNYLIETVQVFSRDIRMSFGFDKCDTVNIKRGKIEDRQQVICNIKQLPPKDTYRYLGLAQNSTIDHTTIKRNIREKYNTRLMKLLNTKLSGHNLIKAINAWAIPVLTYSFGVVKWSNTDLEDLDRLTRRQLTKFRNLHTNSSVYRLYVSRRMGGRGLLNIKDLCLKQKNDMRQRFMSSNCAIMRLIVAQDKGYTPLNLSCRNRIDKPISIEERVAGWKNGALHGRYPKSLQSEGVQLKGFIRHWPGLETENCLLRPRVS